MTVYVVPLLGLVLLASPVYAGAVYEFEAIDHSASGAETGRNRVAIQGERMRVDVDTEGDGAPGHTLLFHGDRQAMITLDHKAKQYFELDQSMVEGISDQMSAAIQQMQEQMKNLPPERRAMVEQMMKSRMGALGTAGPEPVVEVTPTGVREEHGGYGCQIYEVTRNGEKDRETCVADASDIPGGGEASDAIRAIAAFAKKLTSVAGQHGPSGAVRNPFSYSERIDGFPIVTREFQSGKLVSESRLTSAEVRSIEPAEFEPPPGYKKRKAGFEGR